MVWSGSCLLCRTGLTCGIYRQITKVLFVFHHLTHSQMERIPVFLRQVNLVSHFCMVLFQQIALGICCLIQQGQIIAGPTVGKVVTYLASPTVV